MYKSKTNRRKYKISRTTLEYSYDFLNRTPKQAKEDIANGVIKLCPHNEFVARLNIRLKKIVKGYSF